MDNIIWITYRGRKIPIKPGMKGKFDKKKIKEQNKTLDTNKQENIKKELTDEQRKQKIQELEEKRDNTQGFIQKGEIQEEIDMLKDNFKGTKEEYREYIAKENEKRLQEYKKEKQERINQFKQDNNEIDDYRMSHRPSETGLTADNLLKKATNDQDIEAPKDIYDHPEYYSSGDKDYLEETTKQLNKARNNPEAEITIYRATPGDKINKGDWITLSKKYAESHNESQLNGKGNILEMKVKAKDIQFAGDSLEEWGYFPSNENKEIKLYHASNYNINKWDDKHFGENSKGGLTGGNGIYFTNENKNMKVYGKNTYETTFNGKIATQDEANNLFEKHKEQTGKWPDDKQKREIMLKNNIDGANFGGDIVVYNTDKLNNPTIMLKTVSDYEQYYINQGYTKTTALKKAKEIINQRKGK